MDAKLSATAACVTYSYEIKRPPTGVPPEYPLRPVAHRPKVEPAHVRQALAELGTQSRYNQLRQRIMLLTACSKCTAQLAITAACQQGSIMQTDGHYCLPQ